MAFRYSNFPQSIDKLKRLPEYQELSDLDKSYVARYTELCQKGANMTTQDKLEFNDLLNNKLRDKMIQSVDWNLLADAITNMQNFYLNHVLKDISDMVNKKEEEFNTKISAFQDCGFYNHATFYNRNNFVHYNSHGGEVHIYIALKDTQGVAPLDDSSTWRRVTIKGDKGNDGLNLVFKGYWNGDYNYQVGQAVAYDSDIFISMQNDNINNKPNTHDTIYWSKWKQVTMTTAMLLGVRKIVNTTDRVKFLGCGDIQVFNPETDYLEVYKNSTALIKNIQYKISDDNQYIVNLDGQWTASDIEPCWFEFRVKRNQINDLVFSDGQSIQDGTVSKNKLSKEVQNDINNNKSQINNLSLQYEDFEKKTNNLIGDKQKLKTNNKNNLVDAINEVFTCGNNVKSKTVEALLQMDKSLQINDDSNWNDIVQCIKKIKKGIKYVKGSVNATEYDYFVVDNLSFKPKYVLLSGKTIINEDVGTRPLFNTVKSYAYNDNGRDDIYLLNCNQYSLNQSYTRNTVNFTDNGFSFTLNYNAGRRIKSIDYVIFE